MIKDITETKKLLDQFMQLADRDPLTGLFNRRAFYRDGGHLLNKSAVSSETASMIVLEPEHFDRRV